MNTTDQNKAAPNSNYQGGQQKTDQKPDALKADAKKNLDGSKSDGSCGTAKDKSSCGSDKDASSCGTK